MPTAPLRSTTAALLRRNAAPSIAAIWKAFASEDRERAIAGALAERPRIREDLVQRLAEEQRARPASLRKLSDSRLATAARRLQQLPVSIALDILTAFHLLHRANLLSDFLDMLEVRHANGAVSEDSALVELELERLRDACDTILERFDHNDVVVYVACLAMMYEGNYVHLFDWLRDRLAPAEAPTTSVAVTTPTAVQVADGVFLLGRDPDEFTTLDDRLIRVIVECAQGVEGALAEEQVDDLVDEVLQLNNTRRRSYFHVGFRDSIFDRGVQPLGPVETIERRQWYFAGYLTGLARRSRNPEIAALHDAEPCVQTLGTSGVGPGLVAPVVFRALCTTGEYAKATQFLDASCIARLRWQLIPMGLLAARDLLRADRLNDARVLLLLLDQAFSLAGGAGGDLDDDWSIEIGRRLAQCYRRMGQVREARFILESLAKAHDYSRRAEILVDLALIEGGCTRLADVRLPDSTDGRAALLDRLRAGEALVQEALEHGDFGVGHAHYLVGVKCLARDQYAEALPHLDAAVAAFETDTEAYEPHLLLANARMYLALTICQAMDLNRLDRAVDLLRRAHDGGAEVPEYLVTDTLYVLNDRNVEHARDAAEQILKATGDRMLDVLMKAPPPGSEAIALALYRRALDRSRTRRQRLEDVRHAVPALIQVGKIPAAEEVLESLMDMARERPTAEAVLELVADPAWYDPAWTDEEASEVRIACLHALGRHEEVFDELVREFHATLVHSVDDAEEVMKRLQRAGLPGDRVQDLRNRLGPAAAVRNDATPAIAHAVRDLSITLVNGLHRDRKKLVTALLKAGAREVREVAPSRERQVNDQVVMAAAGNADLVVLIADYGGHDAQSCLRSRGLRFIIASGGTNAILERIVATASAMRAGGQLEGVVA